ncbi:MAG: hypothetical protein MZV70_61105 [Desulfobacterales bacterium]|nr:hypothetical protein [Desulfobacterales bacterium]
MGVFSPVVAAVITPTGFLSDSLAESEDSGFLYCVRIHKKAIRKSVDVILPGRNSDELRLLAHIPIVEYWTHCFHAPYLPRVKRAKGIFVISKCLAERPRKCYFMLPFFFIAPSWSLDALFEHPSTVPHYTRCTLCGSIGGASFSCVGTAHQW